MGLIGMPIGPVKTIKREEKCLTTASLLLTQTQGREGREWRREGGLKRNIRGRQRGMRWSDIWEGKAQEKKAQSLDSRNEGLERGVEKGRERGTGMEIKNSKKEEYDAMGWQLWRTTEKKRTSWRIWKAGHSQICHLFLYEYYGICYRKKKRCVTELRVTNKVMVCDQKHKSNTLPLEVVLFGSSKATKPAAPYGQTPYTVALILTTQPINWQPNLQQPTLRNQQHQKRDFLLPSEASNHSECLSAQAPNEEAAAECGNGSTSWWVVVVGANLGSINRSPLSIFCLLPTLKSMRKPIVPRPSVD